jgi:hypothetical protein
MLIGLKMNYTIPNALNYSETLIEYTRGGLTLLGKMGRYSDYQYAKDYDRDFRIAEGYYKRAIEQLKMKGRNQLAEQRILNDCYEINKLIFPIALTEGVLVMNEEMFGVSDMFTNPKSSEPPKRR